jgi:rod shape-determining protein MreD
MWNRFGWVKWVVYAVLCILISAVAYFPSFPRVGGVAPLLAVPCVVGIAMYEGENAGAAYGIFFGLLWDMQSGRAFGFNALLLMIAGIVIGLLVQYLFSNSLFAAVLFTLVTLLLIELITWFFFCYMTGAGQFTFYFLRVILPTAGYTLPFILPVYYAQRWLSRRLAPQE